MPPATRVLAFLLVFTALFLFALAMSIASEFSDAAWIGVIVRIGEGLGRLTFVSIAMSFILVEGVPMLAAWLKREMVREAREQGRAEAYQTWHGWLRDVEAWEQEKAEAEKEGREFTTPRPTPPVDSA